MKLINLKFLLGIFFVFTLTIEAANKVSFSNISELESGNLKIVFNLQWSLFQRRRAKAANKLKVRHTQLASAAFSFPYFIILFAKRPC